MFEFFFLLLRLFSFFINWNMTLHENHMVKACQHIKQYQKGYETKSMLYRQYCHSGYLMKDLFKSLLIALWSSSRPYQSPVIPSVNFNLLWMLCFHIFPLVLLKNFSTHGCLLTVKTILRSLNLR